MENVRFAIAGYGYIAHYHARAIRAAGGELVAVVGRNEVKAREFAEIHGAARVEQHLGPLLEDGAIDALVNALPNKFHAPMCNAAVEGGVHVLVEKPMGLDGTQARRMAKVAARNDRRMLVGHMWRYDPQAIWLRDVVASGEIGEVVKTKAYGIHVNWGPAGWFVDPDLAGGGALIDMGVHAIDTTRFVLGDPAPTRVYARLSTRYGDYDVDDLGIIVIDWDDGATSIIESGWWNPHMDGPEASTQVFGTKGYARLFPNELVRGGGGSLQRSEPTFPPRAEHCDQSIYDAQMIAFVESIRTGEEPNASADVGTVVMDICDAAYRSAASGEAITLG